MAKCHHCGASIVKGDQYCAGCGRPIEEAVYPTPRIKAEPNDQVSEKETGLKDPNKASTAVPSKMRINKLLWFAAFVLLIGISLFYLMKQESGRNFYASLFKHNSNPLLEGFFSEPIILADYRFNDGAPKILYIEDFNSGTVTNWDIWIDHPTSIDPGWLVTKAEDNYCFEGKGHTFARSNSTRRGLIDYSITFRLNILEYSPSGVPFNFSFREVTEPGHKRYFLGISRSGINLIKQSTQSHSTLSDKDFKTLKRASLSINPKRWYDIKVSVRENVIKVYIDDRLVIEHADEEAPYLEGGVAFETLDYGHVLIDDIKITADHLTGAEVLLAEEEQIFIDPLQATVKALRFYEGDENGSSGTVKGYTNNYFAEEARFIYWELYMVCVPGRKTDFEIKVEYFDESSAINDWNELTLNDNDLLDDTSNFESDGRITWTAPADWGLTTVNSVSKYWIRISTTTTPITVAEATYIIPGNSVVGLLALSSEEVLQEEWAWCSYNDTIYVTIRNSGNTAYEGDYYISSSSSATNLKNFFIYNHTFSANHLNSAY